MYKLKHVDSRSNNSQFLLQLLALDSLLIFSPKCSYDNWHKTPSTILKNTCPFPPSQGTDSVLKSRNGRLEPVMPA